MKGLQMVNGPSNSVSDIDAAVDIDTVIDTNPYLEKFREVLDKVAHHLSEYIQCEQQTKITHKDCFLAGEFLVITIESGKLADIMVGCKIHFKSIMEFFIRSGAMSVIRIPISPSQTEKRKSFDVAADQLFDAEMARALEE